MILVGPGFGYPYFSLNVLVAGSYVLLYAGSSSILATEAVVPEVPVPGAILTVLSGFTVSTTKTPARSPSNDSDEICFLYAGFRPLPDTYKYRTTAKALHA